MQRTRRPQISKSACSLHAPASARTYGSWGVPYSTTLFTGVPVGQISSRCLRTMTTSPSQPLTSTARSCRTTRCRWLPALCAVSCFHRPVHTATRAPHPPQSLKLGTGWTSPRLGRFQPTCITTMARSFHQMRAGFSRISTMAVKQLQAPALPCLSQHPTSTCRTCGQPAADTSERQLHQPCIRIWRIQR